MNASGQGINITEPDMHIYIVGNLEYSTDREESKNFKLSRTYY